MVYPEPKTRPAFRGVFYLIWTLKAWLGKIEKCTEHPHEVIKANKKKDF